MVFRESNGNTTRLPEFMWMPPDTNVAWLRIIPTFRDRFWIKCDLSASLLELKLLIEEQEGVSAPALRLIFRGRGLSDERVLTYYGIFPFSALHAVLRLSGETGPYYWVNHGKEQLVFRGHGFKTILDLKNAVSRRLHIPPIRQVLFFHDEPTNDEALLPRFAFSSLTLRILRENKHPPRRIDTAGNIIQDVERDTNNPRIWDVTYSKILNVNIVDYETFRSLTGLKLPKSSVREGTHERMGWPLSDSQREQGRARNSQIHEEDVISGAQTGTRGLGIISHTAAGVVGRIKSMIQRAGESGGELPHPEDEKFREPDVLRLPIILMDA
ncbi:uncharacterized protein BJX67DRAFT_234884 [Aspergillus lucknowensis]|uniref:Ubiquitin-like domain-containing protein n=1 Tax=Aspergillus lucknowensis TaxID=176173 RepID=A0ABR4LGW3_9EURO